MILLITEEIVERIEEEYLAFKKLMLNKDASTIMLRALEIVTKEEAYVLLTNPDYIDSLPFGAIDYFSNYTIEPLEDIWQASLKHPTIDLSPEFLDQTIKKVIDIEVGITDRLNFMEKDTDRPYTRERTLNDERAHE